MSSNIATVQKMLFSEFPTLATAPGGIARIRELILQLAVQGKLVPQNPEDEPASVLLERIKAEKARLVKEGKLKKSKPLPPVTDDEVPFEVPKGWELTKLGAIVEFRYGKSLPNKLRDENGKIPVYGSNGIVGYHSISLVEKPCIIVGRKGSAGAVQLSLDSCYPIDTTYYIEDTDFLNIHYLYYLLFSLKLNLLDKSTAIPGLNRNDAYNLVIGLPPLAEQHRIVEKIDALMKLCDELEAQQEKQREMQAKLGVAALASLTEAEDAVAFANAWAHLCDEFDLIFDTVENVAALRQAILQIAVQGKLVPQNPEDEPASLLLERIKAEKAQLVKEGKIKKSKPLPPVAEDEVPFEVPKGWKWVRLGEISDIKGGITKNSRIKLNDGVVLPYLRVANVQRGYLDLTKIKKIEVPNSKLDELILKKGDILFTEGGDRDKLGRGWVWNEEIPNCTHQNHIFRARLFTQDISVTYLSHYTNNGAQYYFLNSSKQTTNLASINLTQLKHLPLPLPPLSEQHRIVEKVDALMKLCDELEQQIQKKQETQIKLLESVVAQITA